MTDKELHKLSRMELLEMLLAQAQENEKLKEELQSLQAAASGECRLHGGGGDAAERRV